MAKLDGMYVLVTNIIDEEKISKDEIVAIYKQKDVVEKAFEVIKDDLSIHPLYHHLEKRVK
jgi:transposase